MPKYNPEALFAMAKAAGQESLDRNLENTHWFPCGFAGVRIRPARGKLVSWLKENDIGRVDSYAGGYYIPSWVFADAPGSMTQSMTLAEGVASAAANVLREAGLNAYSESRID